MAAAISSCTLPGFMSRANAQTFSSSYTSTAPTDCRQIGKPSDLDGSTTRVCPGKGPVCHIAYIDGQANRHPNDSPATPRTNSLTISNATGTK